MPHVSTFHAFSAAEREALAVHGTGYWSPAVVTLSDETDSLVKVERHHASHHRVAAVDPRPRRRTAGSLGFFAPEVVEEDNRFSANSVSLDFSSDLAALFPLPDSHQRVGCSLRDSERRCAAPEGLRSPCSHFKIVTGGTLSSRPNKAWLRFSPSRSARISFGFIGGAGGGNTLFLNVSLPFA